MAGASKVQAPRGGVSRFTDAVDRDHAAEVRDEMALARQKNKFDFEAQERAELEREYNVLRDMMLEQMKLDDEVVKKYIAMI